MGDTRLKIIENFGMSAKEKAKREIEKLVLNFKNHESQYIQSEYNETQTRREFIDPFFKALGWDIDNSAGLSPAYKEVQHEDRVKVEDRLKSPDYSFRLNGKRYFFVEAKKPSVNIKDDVDPAYQVKRYAWSANLKLSIVTDFEEFAYYDCSTKPLPTDKASKARLNYFRYDEYLEKFDEIWNLFSKESIENGTYDKYVKSEKKKGKNSVDDDFLESLLKWRDLLAKDIFKQNKGISEDHLNFVVQNTIDRIVFLRIAEDRNIEPYGQIKQAGLKKDAYEELFKIFKKADEKYNSGLFDFAKDKVSKGIQISDKCLKEIIENLYFPNSPYEFSVIPVEILGSAYEQFLGKTIQIKGSKIQIEEKPEVRKAGGVYYTPQYIVDYIVQNTVGKLIENKTPKEIEKIKILDPASGSGSFLLGVYDYLLKYHLDWYSKNQSKSKGKKNDPLNPDGSLTTDIKKKILLNNIYGVDIDANAVEVTKLSLLLKCLEGETQASIQQQMTFFNERVLPTLDNNIKCGNSLVDTDFYDIETDKDIVKKIKPFNWESNFPEVFKQGGFDAVIGNPPWGAEFREKVLGYLKPKNIEIIVRMIDSYMFFFKQSHNLLKQNGLLGLITPDVILYQIDNFKLRKFILDKMKIIFALNMGNVFQKVTRPSAIIIAEKCDTILKNHKLKSKDLANIKGDFQKQTELISFNKYHIWEQHSYLKNENFLFITHNTEKYKILNKIRKCNVLPLNSFLDSDGIQRGVSPDFKEAFIVNSTQIRKYNLERKKLKPTLTGGIHIKRYKITYSDLMVIYTTRNDDFSKLPNIKKFIDGYKEKITCKEVIQNKHSIYALHRPRDPQIFEKNSKAIGVVTEDEIVISLDYEFTYPTDGVYLFAAKEGVDIRYLVAILNSRLFVHIYRLLSMETGRIMAQVKPTLLSELPILNIYQENFEINKDHLQVHKNVITFVDKLLKLNKEAAPDKNQIQYYENQIDKLVYELYGLTKDEIKIIEESSNGNS